MIIRSDNRKTFTVISNQLISDNRISDKALGTLVRLLSKPDNWNLNVNHMVKTGKQGRTAIRSSIAELEKAGYIHRQVVRNEAGRITGTEYLVYEEAMAGRQARGKGETEMEPPLTQPGFDGCNKGVGEMATPAVDVPETLTSQVKTSTRDKNQSSETILKETAPVINTNIEQTLRVTTTTTPGQESTPVVEVVGPPSSYPATESINSLLDLIPEQHNQPMVKALVNRALKEYTALEVEEAIVYASTNVKGGWMQYKAYLDKTLKNKWAVGYLETISTTTPAVLSPGVFAGGIPAERFPNGTVTGCARMDGNYMAAAQFLARRREHHDQ